MIRSIHKKFVRGLRTGAWADTTKRSTSLQVPELIEKSLFNEITPENGPASIKDYEAKLRYHSPIGIHEAFEESYKLLSQDAETKESQIEQEQYNPEVLYNFEYISNKLDKSQPIYKKLLQEKWKSKDLMILMQRLESMNVIPDTLPTFNPTAEIKIKFNHNTDPRFIGWLEPGLKLPTFAVSYPPTIQINDYESSDKDLYTILLVNPDVPDLHANTYQTNLHYGLINISIDEINPNWVLENENCLIQDYIPLTPEKNLPYQRACLWVFKQESTLKIDSIKSKSFDIRKFVSDNNITPIGAHLWRQEFDRSVPSIREMYNLPKGNVYLKFRDDEPINKKFLRLNIPYKFTLENETLSKQQANEIEKFAEES